MTRLIITDTGFKIRTFMLSYDDDKQFVEIPLEQFTSLLSEFDREQFTCPVNDAITYGQINNLQHYHDFFSSYNVVHKIHQDSERDLYMVFDHN